MLDSGSGISTSGFSLYCIGGRRGRRNLAIAERRRLREMRQYRANVDSKKVSAMYATSDEGNGEVELVEAIMIVYPIRQEVD